MLKLDDLRRFREFLESGGWADAFSHAEHELRLEMLEKVEELLDAADVADKVVGDIIFGQEGLPPAGSTSSTLKKEGALRRLLLILLLVVLAGSGFGGTYYLMRSPHWSLYQIGKAINQHDPRLFLAYVDVPQILNSQKDDILALVLPNQEQHDQRDMVRQLLGAFMQPIIEQVRERISKVISDPKRENLPSSLTLALAANVTTNGDYALVVLNDPRGGGDRLRLGMHRAKDAHWRVVQINAHDLRQLANKHLLPGLLGGASSDKPAESPEK